MVVISTFNNFMSHEKSFFPLKMFGTFDNSAAEEIWDSFLLLLLLLFLSKSPCPLYNSFKKKNMAAITSGRDDFDSISEV